jgi:hypothetical protein
MVEPPSCSNPPLLLECLLTKNGESFQSVIVALRACGDVWSSQSSVRGQSLGLESVRWSCADVLRRNDLIANLNRRYARERQVRASAFKDRSSHRNKRGWV